MSGMLVSSMAVGLIEYINNKDTFSTVASMHTWSYTAGILGGLLMTYYIYNRRKPIKQPIRFSANGIALYLVSLFAKN